MKDMESGRNDQKESEDRAHHRKVIIRVPGGLGTWVQWQSACSVTMITAILKNKFSDVRLREKPVFSGN